MDAAEYLLAILSLAVYHHACATSAQAIQYVAIQFSLAQGVCLKHMS